MAFVVFAQSLGHSISLDLCELIYVERVLGRKSQHRHRTQQ